MGGAGTRPDAPCTCCTPSPRLSQVDTRCHVPPLPGGPVPSRLSPKLVRPPWTTVSSSSRGRLCSLSGARTQGPCWGRAHRCLGSTASPFTPAGETHAHALSMRRVPEGPGKLSISSV